MDIEKRVVVVSMTYNFRQVFNFVLVFERDGTQDDDLTERVIRFTNITI